MCSNRNFSSDDPISLFVNDNGTMTRDCSCEITTNTATYICLSSYPCLQCRNDRPTCVSVLSDRCLCGGVNLTISPSCITFGNGICQDFPRTYCPILRKLTLTLSMKQSTRCSNFENSPFIIQLSAYGKCHFVTTATGAFLNS